MNEPAKKATEPEAEKWYGHSVVGDWALQHKGGWWAGSDDGATTYPDYYHAQVALTILWQRDGGRALHFAIERFTGANIMTGDFTLTKGAAEAIDDFESKTKT